MMFWLVVVTTLTCMAVAGVMVFRSTRNAQVMDRRLAGVRAWAVAVYGEPQKRRKQEGSGFSLRQVSSALLNVSSRLVPVGAAERAKLKDLVMKAGFHRPDALSVFMTVKLVVTLAGGTLLGFQMATGQWLGDYTSTPTILLVGLAGAVVGGILPEICLDRLGARRQRRMATALPDALDLMTLCLESGLTFERTLSRVVQELETMAPELAREFALAEAELRLGAERKNVLNDLHVRTGVEGLRDLSTTITQGERYWDAAGPIHAEYRPQRATTARGPDCDSGRTAAGADEHAHAAAGDAGDHAAGCGTGLCLDHRDTGQHGPMTAATGKIGTNPPRPFDFACATLSTNGVSAHPERSASEVEVRFGPCNVYHTST